MPNNFKRYSILCLILCAVLMGCPDSQRTDDETSYTLTYTFGKAVSPAAIGYSYIFESDGTANLTVTINFDSVVCGEETVTLSSSDLATLRSAISAANLMNQSDLITGDCIGTSPTTIAYSQGSQSNSFGILLCDDTVQVPEEIVSLREVLYNLITSYFTSDITCPEEPYE